MNGTYRPHEMPPPRRNVLASAALAVSAAGVVFAYLPLAFVFSIPLGLAGLVLAVLARRAAAAPERRGRGHDMAVAAAFTAGFALLLGTLGAMAAWNATRLPYSEEVVPMQPAATTPAGQEDR